MRAVNLIPTDQRPAGKTASAGAVAQPTGPKAFGAYVVLGALVFAIGATALYTLASNTIKDNKAQLQQVQQEEQTVSQQASALQAFADFKQLSLQRTDTIRGLASARFSWHSTLDDVSRALPDDVFISSFDGSTSSGTSGSSLRGAIQAPSIELNGCTNNQASVARLMSRLRDVRGVTRVSLSKSASVDSTETAAAPAPATAADGSEPALTTEPCPKGTPPAFDVVVFFERAAVSANAAPNAAGPSAGQPVGTTGAAGPTGAAGTTAATTPPTTP